MKFLFILLLTFATIPCFALLNAEPTLSSPVFSQAYEYTVMLDIEKANDAGHCLGTFVHSKFVITAQHCIQDATQIEVYFLFPASSKKLVRTKVKMIGAQVVEARTTGRDIAILLIDEIPAWAKSIDIIDYRHRHEAPNTFVLGYEHRYQPMGLPFPFSESPRLLFTGITNIQLRPAIGYQINYPTYNTQQTATCKGDSGGSVITIKNSTPTLAGVFHSNAIRNDLTRSNTKNPRSKMLGQLDCSSSGIYGDIGHHVGSIYSAEGELLRKHGL